MRILALTVLFLAGCARDLNEVKTSQPDWFEKNLKYRRDSRTGICFAVLRQPASTMYEVDSITAVNCTADVQKLLEKP
jgi:hypothetical protein